ncbi:MAG TPA: CvpA family protein [Candidatus Limnocylindria bacterium]|nr:CvpA family protein [Candidatus Limnocylindria bacterium]
MADIVIIGAVTLGAIAGWRKGFVLPLIALAGGLLAATALYAGPLNGVVPSGTAGIGLGAVALFAGGSLLGKIGGMVTALVFRFNALRRVDQAAGIPLGAVTAAVGVYVTILGILTLDGWLEPLHGKDAFAAPDIAAIQSLAAVNPSLAVFAEPTVLQALIDQAKKAPVTSEQLAKIDATLAFYEQTVRPELLQSHIAPLLLAFGERLPVIGRHAELPTR